MAQQDPNQPESYDDIYFDTDEEIEQFEKESDRVIETTGGQSRSKPKVGRKILSDDDLLYDPQLDDRDEAWMANQIKKASTGVFGESEEALPKTDGILTCPMCFSPLCYSCQRHSQYRNQYRAMFVKNCKVDKTRRYHYTSTGLHKKAPPKDEMDEDHDDEAYYRVDCGECGTQVAMLDQDEVYHFFNVIAD